MAFKHVSSPFGDYTDAVSVAGPGRWIYVSGQVGLDEDGKLLEDVSAHAEASIRNIAGVLERDGASLADIVKLTVFYTDRQRLEEFKAARAAHFEPPFPAATAIHVLGVGAQAGLEIEAVAFVPEGRSGSGSGA
jgi:enamine deaminase RidA (YjgF/YER057c/UK114 family)